MISTYRITKRKLSNTGYDHDHVHVHKKISYILILLFFAFSFCLLSAAFFSALSCSSLDMFLNLSRSCLFNLDCSSANSSFLISSEFFQFIDLGFSCLDYFLKGFWFESNSAISQFINQIKNCIQNSTQLFQVILGSNGLDTNDNSSFGINSLNDSGFSTD